MKLPLLLTLFLCSSIYTTPKESLSKLMNGNERYVKDAFEEFKFNTQRREALVCKQKPFAIIVGCADSRVPPELIFDQGLGDLFVVRVAGNVIGGIELDSVIYSALVLQSSVILVLGHENCGAVKAVIDGDGKKVPYVAKLIEPAVKTEKKKNPPFILEACVKRNAINMKNLLLENSLLKGLVKDNKLSIHAGYYNLESGVVDLIEESSFLDKLNR